MVDEAHGTGALGPGGRGAVADAGARGRGRRRGRARSARRSAPTAPTSCCDTADGQVPGQHRAHADLLHGAAAAGGGGRDGRARAAARAAAPGREAAAQRRACCATALAAEGLDTARLARRRSCRSWSATPAQADDGLRAGARARRVRAGDPAADRARGHARGCGSR